MNIHGRPTVLDATKKEIIYALLRAGVSQRTAADAVGVGEATIRYAKKHDPEFALRAAQAEATLQVELVVKLRQNAGRSWRAAAYALEHLCKERFGKPEKPDENELERERQIERELADMEAAAELEAEAIAKGQSVESPPKPNPNSPEQVATRQFGEALIKLVSDSETQQQEEQQRQRERFNWQRERRAKAAELAASASA